MPAKREKVHFESVQELLGAPEVKEGATEIRIDQIYSFENHPFKVLDDDRMTELVESIQANGIIVPVLVRPDNKGTYEMISGHRRMHAAKIVGLNVIPAIIKDMTNDEATIAMVDANVQREEILPSERAFSLKMKMDAMNRQGARTDLTLGRDVPKWSHEELGKDNNLSGRQIKRYIRLTELIPELLSLVDEKRLGLMVAVDISFYDKEIQKWIFEYIRENGMIRSTQIAAIREQKNPENMTQYTLMQILNDALPQKKDDGKITFTHKKLDQFFPANLTSTQREKIIIELLSNWKEKQAAEK
jgi:ParB family chromosome partitioning protein